MRLRLLTALIAVALLAASCGDDDETGEVDAAQGPTTAQTAASDAPAAGAGAAADVDLALSTTPLGDILVDAEGMTLYLFMPDVQGDSTCYDQCATNWPPVGPAAAVGAGLDESLLGATTRTDGTVQTTYNGWPLYRFARDAAPGDINGQGANDVWYVVDSMGNAVSASTSSTPSTAASSATPGY